MSDICIGDEVYTSYPGLELEVLRGIVVEIEGDKAQVWLDQESHRLLRERLKLYFAQPSRFKLDELAPEVCPRCKGKSKIDLCNELGDYGACVDAIEHWYKEFSEEHGWAFLSDDRGHFLSRIEMALRTLEEALQERERVN